jgi:hypothetical protein
MFKVQIGSLHLFRTKLPFFPSLTSLLPQYTFYLQQTHQTTLNAIMPRILGSWSASTPKCEDSSNKRQKIDTTDLITAQLNSRDIRKMLDTDATLSKLLTKVNSSGLRPLLAVSNTTPRL